MWFDISFDNRHQVIRKDDTHIIERLRLIVGSRIHG